MYLCTWATKHAHWRKINRRLFVPDFTLCATHRYYHCHYYSLAKSEARKIKNKSPIFRSILSPEWMTQPCWDSCVIKYQYLHAKFKRTLTSDRLCHTNWKIFTENRFGFFWFERWKKKNREKRMDSQAMHVDIVVRSAFQRSLFSVPFSMALDRQCTQQHDSYFPMSLVMSRSIRCIMHVLFYAVYKRCIAQFASYFSYRGKMTSEYMNKEKKCAVPILIWPSTVHSAPTHREWNDNKRPFHRSKIIRKRKIEILGIILMIKYAIDFWIKTTRTILINPFWFV